ncbi:MAG: chemotaxis protein CheW [Nitrospirota bacterium]
MTSNYLVFSLIGRLYGARLLGAIEILPWMTCRRIPLTYSYIEGVIDYRGTIYPIFNTKKKFGLMTSSPAAAPEDPGSAQSIILLSENKIPFGITVDGVARMASMEEVPAVPGKKYGIDSRSIKGIAYEDDREIIILNFERLFYAD